MSKTTFFASKMLDHWLGGATYAQPVTVYLALFTVIPTTAYTSASPTGTEVSGGSYARLALTNNNTNWGAASAGSKSNLLKLTFAQATADWGSINGVGIMDALTGGNLLEFAAPNTVKSILAGDYAEFQVGSLLFSET